MAKYKVGDKIVHRTDIIEAYYHNLVNHSDLSFDQLNFCRHYAVDGYKDSNLFREMTFYGTVTDIKEGNYACGTPYRQVNVLLSNGKMTGFFEDKVKRTEFRKASLLENIIFKFSPKPVQEEVTVNGA